MPSPAKPAAPVAAAETVTEAPAASATVTTTTAHSGQANALDTILVVGTLLIIAGVIAALIFVSIDQSQLAIIASLASGLMGAVVGGYTGYRWGASDALKKLTSVSTSAQ
jgi:uncharacterized membrane protein YeaQ/YmgE (transglycosylase-associated protein family)